MPTFRSPTKAPSRRSISWLPALRRQDLAAYAWQAVLILLAVTATLVAGFLQFNVSVAFEAQGRYLFLLLLPGALLLTSGLYRLVPGRRLKTAALAIPLLWLAMMNIVGPAVVR